MTFCQKCCTKKSKIQKIIRKNSIRKNSSNKNNENSVQINKEKDDAAISKENLDKKMEVENQQIIALNHDLSEENTQVKNNK